MQKSGNRTTPTEADVLVGGNERYIKTIGPINGVDKSKQHIKGGYVYTWITDLDCLELNACLRKNLI